MRIIYTKRVYTRSMCNTVILEVVVLSEAIKYYRLQTQRFPARKVINSRLNWRRVSQLARNSSTRTTFSLDSYLLSAFPTTLLQGGLAI